MSDEPLGGFRRGRSYDVHSSEDDEPHSTSLRSSGREMPTSMSSSQLQPSAKYPQPAPRRTRSSGQDLSDTRMQSPRDFSNDSKEDSRDHGSSKRGNLQYQPEKNLRCDRDMKSGINFSQDVGDESVQIYHEDLPKKLENGHHQKNERKQADSDDDSRRYAPSKEYDHEKPKRRRMKSPHPTDQDSDHDSHDSRRYAPSKEYDNQNAPRRRVKSPHHTDQDSDHDDRDSRRYAPGKEYDNQNAPRRRAKSPLHSDQDSDHDDRDSRRYAPGKEYDNQNAPRRRAKSPHPTDQDSDHDDRDSRYAPRYAPSKGYNQKAPRRRVKSPHPTDQDSDHDDRDSRRYAPRYAPSKEYDNENAPRRVKSPHHTDQDDHDFRKSASSKDYEYAPRKGMRGPYHTDHDGYEYAPEERLKSHQQNYKQDPEHYHQIRTQNDYGDYQRRQRDQQHSGNAPPKGGYGIDHDMNIPSVTTGEPNPYQRSSSDRRYDNEKDKYLQNMDNGRRNECWNDNRGRGAYHKNPGGIPPTIRRDYERKDDFQQKFEGLTIDEKTQSKGPMQYPVGASNYLEYRSSVHHSKQDRRPFKTREREYLPSGDVRNDPYHYHSNKPPLRQEKPVFSAISLMIILHKWPTYEASMLQLIEKCGLLSSDIRSVVSSNPNLFEMKQEIVRLRLKVKICDAHVSSRGCINKSLCKGLHICPKFVMSYCMDMHCTFGHSLDSGHNTSVLKPFLINSIPESRIRLEILKLSIPPTKSQLQLKVCYNYSPGKCQRTTCDYLHICNDYLMRNCVDRSCTLSHVLLSKENCRVLQNHGIDTNESPRDVLKILKDTHPSLFTPQRSDASNRNYSADQSNTYPGGNTGNFRSRDDNITPSNSRPAGTEYRQNISNPNQGNSAQRGNSYSSGETSNSVWSFHYEGNTEIAEICFYSVTSRCRYEDTGCKRLHAKEHYHWQVKERGKGWVNLRKDQVDSLESAYCDPDKDGVQVPSIDPNNCPKGLLKLFGQDRWQADFKSMLMDNPKTNVTLNLRRLCSEDVDGSVKACKNQWYFLDQNNVWIQYGNTDTTKRDFLASNITSNDIERHFIKSPSVPLTFKNSMFLYVLDFGTMMQTNTQTKVSRKVKRRPVPHMQHNNQPKPGLMSKLMSWTSAS